MENKKGSGIFLSVIGVATLIVAIIGATFAYFSASVVSNNQAVRVESTVVQLAYGDELDGLNTDMIPTEDKYALYAGTNEDWINLETEGATGLCKDDNNNEICSTYIFTIANPNYGTAIEINGRVRTTVNKFENLKFAIYDEENRQVMAPTAFPTTSGQAVEFTAYDVDGATDGKSIGINGQQLLGSSGNNADTKPITKEKIEAGDLSEIVKVDEDGDGIAANMRTYKMVIWIEETGGDQTEADSGKMFTAAIEFDTGAESGVTGIISAAG